MLISTGAGSTGWLSSLFNMTEGFSRAWARPARTECSCTGKIDAFGVGGPRTIPQLPLGCQPGRRCPESDEELVIGSQMPSRGVIFSNGVEDDFLEFSSGTIAQFTVSTQRTDGLCREKENLKPRIVQGWDAEWVSTA